MTAKEKRLDMLMILLVVAVEILVPATVAELVVALLAVLVAIDNNKTVSKAK